MPADLPSFHDSFAADYDAQVRAWGSHLADIVFGLCYEYVQPGQRLLDAGCGSGLAGALFARAGLEVHGFDFSPAMLEQCRAKRFARELTRHDILHLPWPYPTRDFDVLVCVGVLHFLSGLEPVFAEAGRILSPGGVFACTTKTPPADLPAEQIFASRVIQGAYIYEHAPAYLAALADEHGFHSEKTQFCFTGEDLFRVDVLRRRA